MKKVNNFQLVKVQPQRVLLSFCMIFWQFQPGVAYKKGCNTRASTPEFIHKIHDDFKSNLKTAICG